MAPKALIELRNARVLIVDMGGYWFAQCLDIDYCAQGDSLEDVKSNFEKGFLATIKLNLDTYGSLDNFMKRPPLSVMDDLPDPSVHSFSVIAEHEIENNVLPYFDHIQYLMAKEQAAA
jgi:hypothetical protein